MKKIGIIFALALFLIGVAGEAQAYGWSDFKANIGIGKDVREMEKTGQGFGQEQIQL